MLKYYLPVKFQCQLVFQLPLREKQHEGQPLLLSGPNILNILLDRGGVPSFCLNKYLRNSLIFYMQHVLIDGIKYDLPALEKDCWHRLVNGAVQGRNPMHNATVANLGEAGINMRTVVLRKVSPIEKRLTFYTDIRSGKWGEIEQDNSISWLLYDAAARIQIRASGLASLHQTDELADLAWSSSNVLNRKNYLSVLVPSAATLNPVSGLTQEMESEEITLEQTEEGRKNFGVITTQIKWMEWLWLNGSGHRRASFVYDEAGKFTANWLVP